MTALHPHRDDGANERGPKHYPAAATISEFFRSAKLPGVGAEVFRGTPENCQFRFLCQPGSLRDPDETGGAFHPTVYGPLCRAVLRASSPMARRPASAPNLSTMLAMRPTARGCGGRGGWPGPTASLLDYLPAHTLIAIDGAAHPAPLSNGSTIPWKPHRAVPALVHRSGPGPSPASRAFRRFRSRSNSTRLPPSQHFDCRPAGPATPTQFAGGWRRCVNAITTGKPGLRSAHPAAPGGPSRALTHHPLVPTLTTSRRSSRPYRPNTPCPENQARCNRSIFSYIHLSSLSRIYDPPPAPNLSTQPSFIILQCCLLVPYHTEYMASVP